MIEQFQTLAASVGAERMNITIEDAGQGKASVVIQAVLGTAPNDMTAVDTAHRQALAQPLVIKGFAGEVDAQLETLLDGYLASAKPALDRLVTNADEIASATKGAALNAESIADDDSQSTTGTQTETHQSNDISDSLATGVADSL